MLGNLFNFNKPLTLFGGAKRAAAQQEARNTFTQQFAPNISSFLSGRPAGATVGPVAPRPPASVPSRTNFSPSDSFLGLMNEAVERQRKAEEGAERARALASKLPTPFQLESALSQGDGPVPKDSVFGITTNPGGPLDQFTPEPYPTVLPSLSAEQLGALSERRRLADERLKRAEAESEKRTELLQAGADRARADATRTSQRTIQDFMRGAAGRGLARSPMVAGRQARREGEDLRLAYGEIDTRLSTDIMALQDLVARASEERDAAIGAIEQERVNMQADLERLFPAARTYGG